ncbi:MAG: DUF2281 domain-containing protein [Tychonema bourrellyi B0820]|uniref:DUF2281 domain-containing protein n=1 Tax=Tychonema bourrellyi FEM_GT703 TaxID=2040638 RepID=A0A2G4EXP0_9CYAN|nr:DUF2281 domain-containing protein [Tychonema bourrellyi]MDQ2098665.1 DUF2281 domain-containing protein [Tychonema bourrellyi B0820]PHX54303.1 DUF2281 domain-containing protein [Tychonema bourrellyi FEM_GT703]
MNLEQAVVDKLRTLPPERQQEVLDFAEFLQQKTIFKRPLKSVKGMCADLKVDITEEDIAQVRQEMWKYFPREDI